MRARYPNLVLIVVFAPAIILVLVFLVYIITRFVYYCIDTYRERKMLSFSLSVRHSCSMHIKCITRLGKIRVFQRIYNVNEFTFFNTNLYIFLINVKKLMFIQTLTATYSE